MSWKKMLGGLLLAWLSFTLGCSPGGSSAADEEKEPLFLSGRSRVNSMDYRGAIEAFEQALETNPRSGAAHFELGWLYAEKEADPAAAIFHYETFLKLRPGAGNAETVRQHIFRLKQELAKGVLPIPPASDVQRQLEQLAEENRRLREELERLRVTPAAATAVPTNRSAGPTRARVATTTTPHATTLPTTESKPNRVAGSRVHRVQAGETPTAIARRYNVRVETLLAANPGLNPKRLQVGQNLTIPSP